MSNRKAFHYPKRVWDSGVSVSVGKNAPVRFAARDTLKYYAVKRAPIWFFWPRLSLFIGALPRRNEGLLFDFYKGAIFLLLPRMFLNQSSSAAKSQGTFLNPGGVPPRKFRAQPEMNKVLEGITISSNLGMVFKEAELKIST